MMSIAWQLCRRHWAAFLGLTFWLVFPGLVGAFAVAQSDVLRFSWMGAGPFAIYMYHVTSGSQLLGILPLARREVWQITTLVGAVAPAGLQFIVGAAMVMLASLLLPVDSAIHIVGIDTVALSAVYTLGFLHLVLIATAGVRRRALLTASLAVTAIGVLLWTPQALPSSVAAFTTTSALAFWVAAVVGVVLVRVPGSLAAPVPARMPSYRLALDLPGIGLLDRLTGVKRILLMHTLLGVVAFGAAFGWVLVMTVWKDGATMAEVVSDELRAFSGTDVWVMRPGDSLFFMPMWVIGLANVWSPMARQLRVLPLTPHSVNAVFLSSPIIMWVVLWAMYLVAYALIVGSPITPRFDFFLALSGTSTLANVISLRWRNKAYGMVGGAFVYGFWMLASIVALVLGLNDATIPLTVIGAAFYAAAVLINQNTLLHATSGSPAYQRQPKFFDTPARG